MAAYNEAVGQLRNDAELQQEAAAAQEAADDAVRAIEEAEQRATDAFLRINRQRELLDADLTEARDLVAATEDRLADAEGELQRLRQQVESGDDTHVLFALQDVGFALDDTGFAVQDAEWALEDVLRAVAELEATADALQEASAAAGGDTSTDQDQVAGAQDDASEYRSSVSQMTHQLEALQPRAAELWQQAAKAAGSRAVHMERIGYGAG